MFGCPLEAPFQGDGGSSSGDRGKERRHACCRQHGTARRAACGDFARRKPSGREPNARGVSGGKVSLFVKHLQDLSLTDITAFPQGELGTGAQFVCDKLRREKFNWHSYR